MVLAAALLVLALLPFAWFLRKDPAELRAFKALTDTRARQRRFLIWTLKSFLFFGCASLAALAILGRLSALVTLPPEFQPLAGFHHPHAPNPALITGILIGMAGSIAGIFFGMLIARRKKQKQAFKPVALGDLSPLLPRNWAETAHTALLSINAGFSEELYFRLLLPLLLAILIGHAIPAFILAAILFGLAHVYQGPIGVIATAILGLLLTLVYLFSGSIWDAMAIHAFIDLIGLVIRPSISRLFSREQLA